MNVVVAKAGLVISAFVIQTDNRNDMFINSSQDLSECLRSYWNDQNSTLRLYLINEKQIM